MRKGNGKMQEPTYDVMNKRWRLKVNCHDRILSVASSKSHVLLPGSKRFSVVRTIFIKRDSDATESP